jgi:superfamily II DNA/RNA helicase
MFKKILSLFSKSPSEAPKPAPARSDSPPPADDRRDSGSRRRRPRKPAGERQQGDQRQPRPQGERPQAAQEASVDGDAPKKRRRRRRKPAGERTANAEAQSDAPAASEPSAAPRADRPAPRASREPRPPREQRTDSDEPREAREPRPPREPRAESDEPRAPREPRSGGRSQRVEAITGSQPRTEYFGDLRVSKPVAAALADMGYTEPTPIQAEVIVPMLAGDDLVGQAQTGTGKTAGFGIPLAEAIDGSQDYVQAIVLVPTRELAQQVCDEITRIVKYRGINIVAVYGGAPIAKQIAGLEANAHLIVGTPGRVIDLLNRGNLRLDKASTVILDEADQMLDIGFLPDIRTILRQTSRDRQTALFTATVPTQIRRLIYSYLKDPKTIRVGEESEAAENVRQMYAEVARRDKLDALKEVFETIDSGEQTLVFRRTQGDVDWLVKMLKQRRMPAEAIHGGLRQSERNTVMQNFRDGKVKILVSTNLTSRGIDVPAVAHVINYDCPEQVEEYVHRIGRTARMGRDGTAVTFVGEWDMEFFDAIRKHVGDDKLEVINLAMYGDPNRGGPIDEDDEIPEDGGNDAPEVRDDAPVAEVAADATDADEDAPEAEDDAPVAEVAADDAAADADDDAPDDSEATEDDDSPVAELEAAEEDDDETEEVPEDSSDDSDAADDDGDEPTADAESDDDADPKESTPS